MGSVFLVWATAAPGQSLDEVERALDVELTMLLSDGFTETELRNAQTAWKTSFVRRMERPGGFGGIANQLNTYNRYLGNPGMFDFDFNRYADATRERLLEYSRRQLDPSKRATLRIVPRGDYTVVASDLDRSVMPAGGPEPSFSPPFIQTAELSNGLQVMLVEDHSLPLVQAQLTIRSGYSADPSGTPGAASLTAELLDEGTTSRGALELDQEERRLGAQLSTRSNFDGSFVTLNVLKSSLDDGMTLMSDVVLNPAFPEEELERQRRIYMGRIAQESKEARASALRTFYRVLYGEEHPYGQAPSGTGTTESIQAITRDDLVTFYGANYKPNNSALLFAGDLTLAEAEELAEKYFGRWERGMVTMPDLAEPEPITGTHVYIVDKPGAAQTYIVAGHLGLKRSDSDYRAIQVMNNALGGKFTSRINLNLREDKGYTYGARSVFVTRRETGPFLVLAPVQAFSTKESVVEILRELRDIVGERPISAQEAAETRDNIIKGFPRQFETLGGVTGQLSTIFMYELPLDEWERYATEITAVTAELASQAARDRINPEALLIVLIGDREQIEPGIRELGLGEVQFFAASGEE